MTLDMPALLGRKRDGGTLADEEIEAFCHALGDGSLSEAQAGAFAMAVRIRGMTLEETIALTRGMRASGTSLVWSLPGPVLDKHSTGGVGDKVSLILAPLLAACGAYVPMISGRGLGHTGGTLDKLESIPGVRTSLDRAAFAAVVEAAGCAIVGASSDLAPADRRLYAIRDVTATVDSRPLIVGSILAKKLAAGLDALVMDVKTGSGAFLPESAEAREMADWLERVAAGAGLPCQCLLTDMSQCLGRTAGNALEVSEALEVLKGGPAEPRLLEIVMELVAMLLVAGALAPDRTAAKALARERLSSGQALERFARFIAHQGGPAGFVERPEAYLPVAPVCRAVTLARPAHVAAIEVRELGLAVVGLGGGRSAPDEAIDGRVGLSCVQGIGAAVGPDQPFCIVHATSEGQAERAVARIRAAVTLADEVKPVPTAILPEGQAETR